MLFISFGKKSSTRKLTPEKVRRLEGLRLASAKRRSEIQRAFDSMPKAKALIKSIGEASSEINKILEPGHISVPKRRLKSLYIKKHSNRIKYLNELRAFAVGKGASPNFLKFLDKMDSTERASLETAIKFL